MNAGDCIGPYQVRDEIAAGGMATVCRVWHTGLHRLEAMKMPHAALALDPDFLRRFLQEARIAAKLHHPNVAQVYAVSDEGAPQPYITMELVEGDDLATVLAARGSLPLAETAAIIAGIAAGLDHAHSRGVIHRDVKPSNVLLQPMEDGSYVPKVVDFGIARAQEGGGTRMTRVGMVVGTPEYISPEQAGSGAPVDHRTDVYALGVMAYEMLCGRPPFPMGEAASALSVLVAHVREEPTPPAELVRGLPRQASDAVLHALAKDPARRYQSAAEFAQALGAAARGKAAAAAAPATPATPATASAVPAPAARSGPFARPTEFGAPAAPRLPRRRPVAFACVAVLAGSLMIAVGLRHPRATVETAPPPPPPPPRCTNQPELDAKLGAAERDTAALEGRFLNAYGDTCRSKALLTQLKAHLSEWSASAAESRFETLKRRAEQNLHSIEAAIPECAGIENRVRSLKPLADARGCDAYQLPIKKALTRTLALHYGMAGCFEHRADEARTAREEAARLDPAAIVEMDGKTDDRRQAANAPEAVRSGGKERK